MIKADVHIQEEQRRLKLAEARMANKDAAAQLRAKAELAKMHARHTKEHAK